MLASYYILSLIWPNDIKILFCFDSHLDTFLLKGFITENIRSTCSCLLTPFRSTGWLTLATCSATLTSRSRKTRGSSSSNPNTFTGFSPSWSRLQKRPRVCYNLLSFIVQLYIDWKSSEGNGLFFKKFWVECPWCKEIQSGIPFFV